MLKKTAIFICAAALAAPLITNVNGSSYQARAAEKTDSDKDASVPYSINWYVNTDVDTYKAINIMAWGINGETYDGKDLLPDLPEGFEYKSAPANIKIKRSSNPNDLISYKGYIKRIYSVKPDKSKQKELSINYYNGDNLVKTQKISGYQGQTVPVKFDLPKGYNFKSFSNEAMYVAFPGSKYTFATDNPSFSVQLTPTETDDQSGQVTIHYLDNKTNKEINKQVLKGKADTDMELSYMYPPIDIDKASLMNQDKSYLKIIPKDQATDKGLAAVSGSVHLTDKNQDIYVWVSPDGKPVEKEAAKPDDNSSNGSSKDNNANSNSSNSNDKYAIPMMPITQKQEDQNKQTEESQNKDNNSNSSNQKENKTGKDQKAKTDHAKAKAAKKHRKRKNNFKQVSSNDNTNDNNQAANSNNDQAAKKQNDKKAPRKANSASSSSADHQKTLPQTNNGVKSSLGILGLASLALSGVLMKLNLSRKD